MSSIIYGKYLDKDVFMDINSIILMAGLGTRMKSEKPKILHKVMGRAIADYVCLAAKNAGSSKIYGVVGHNSEAVTNHFNEEIEFVVQDKQMGTGDALKKAIPKLSNFDGNLLVLCGDAPLINAEILEQLVSFHDQEKADVTVLTGILDEGKEYGRIYKDSSNNILGIVEAKECDDNQIKIREVNSGVYCLNWSKVKHCLEYLPLHLEKNEYFLTDIVSVALDKSLKVKTFVSADPAIVLGINSRYDLSVVGSIIRQRILRRHMDQGVTIVDPDNTYIDDQVCIGLDSVIYPYTVIEGNVEIGASCQVGPFAHIRTGSVLKDSAEVGNFVEVKNSVIDNFSKAKHLTYLGDALIGKKVNIGAGTITANYDGKNKSRTIIEDGSFIGSGSILIAPVKVGKNAVTGAGAVVVKEHNVAEGATVIGVPARVIKKNK